MSDLYLTRAMVLLLCLLRCINGEIIVLNNGKNLTCFNDVNEQSSLYFYPVTEEQSEHLTPSLELDVKMIYKNSTEFFLAPVTDIRWQHFKIFHDNYTKFDAVKSAAFSILPGRIDNLQIDFILNTKDTSVTKHLPLEKSEEWLNINIIIQNGKTYIKKLQQLVQVYDIDPHRIVVRSSQYTYWKVHNYKWISIVSEGESKIVLDSKEEECLIVYSFCCTNCFLNVSVNNGVTYNVPCQQNSEESVTVNTWKFQRHDLKPNAKNIINIYAGKSDDSGEKYWGLDFRFCPNPNNNINKITTVWSENKKCHLLHSQKHLKGNDTTKVRGNHTFVCEELGKLGKNCEISCKEILGEQYPYCEGHKICENYSACSCGWGYKGNNCTTPCDSGTWGINCKHECSSNCTKSCSRITGVCEAVQSSIKIYLIPLGVVVLAAALIASAIFCFRKKRLQNTRDETSPEAATPLNDISG